MGNIFSKAYMTIVWLGRMHQIDERKKLFRKDPTWLMLIPELYQDKYWGQAWTIQEFVLAHDITALIDDFALSYEQLSKGEGYTPRHYKLKAEFSGSQHKMPLMCLLSEYRHQLCSVPRDRIHSLLSLVNEGDEIAIDYALPHADLAFNVLRTCERYSCRCSLRLFTEVLELDSHTTHRYESGPFVKTTIKRNWIIPFFRTLTGSVVIQHP
jgi:hypothetical protein